MPPPRPPPHPKCVKIAQGGRYGFGSDHLPRSLTAWLDPNCQVTLWAVGWNVLPPSVVNINYRSSSHITTNESPLCKANEKWGMSVPKIEKKGSQCIDDWWFVGQRKLMKLQSGNMATQSLTMQYNDSQNFSLVKRCVY